MVDNAHLTSVDTSTCCFCPEVAPRVPRYKLVEDWETEVERLGAAGYKATTCNKAFRIASRWVGGWNGGVEWGGVECGGGWRGGGVA